ncbi:MAG: PilT/PilU family type 4a pilus ATPase [Acidobacteria bacterium]|nr:PilT/PilU family type 4a pilus ATPase [Acidobacteriota bacterium]
MSDFERAVDALNALDGAGAGAAPGSRLERWLSRARALGASDLLLVAGVPPMTRIDGKVRPLDGEDVLDGTDIGDAVEPALPEHSRRAYREGHAVDARVRTAAGRFRVNLHRERGRAAAAIRVLPTVPPRLSALNLPVEVEALSRIPRGLVLVGGATGVGKTTTLAALVDDINRRDERHIVTIEDPIEYEHPHQRSVVEHIEVGIDAPDFASALRSAVRQAPDVIVVGEMRDPETMQIALAAAETGHVVFSSVHTTDAASTIARIADAFPPERQPTVRQDLAMALAAVYTQTLLPHKGGGLVPAGELLMMSYGARQQVRKNALQHLHQEITMTRKHGSFTLEDALNRLVREQRIERAEAVARAVHPDEILP